MYFLRQFWSFVLSSLCIWLYVFAPGSHCFAIDMIYYTNRSAICTIHFRSIWTAPLRFSTCRSFGRQQSNCSKTGPKKIKVPPSQLDVQMCFFTCFAFFIVFTKCIFKTHFSHFFQAHFQNAFSFFTFLHMIVKNVKEHANKMRFENGLGEKCEKHAFWKCEKMRVTCEDMWKKGNKRQLKSSCFLAPLFPMCFSRYRFFFKFSLKSNFKL